jgi:hypothetical protein
MAAAKEAAMPFWSAVRSRNAHQVQQITAAMDRDELAALAVVLAEGADGMRLKAVTQAFDDGLPEGAARRRAA